MKTETHKSTTILSELEWTISGFTEQTAQEYWALLPTSLQNIALKEIEHGNKISSILKNSERGIVLLAFSQSPLSPTPSDQSISIHTKHDYGNYCYDGTKCTYEHSPSGCFLAFEDPSYVP